MSLETLFTAALQSAADHLLNAGLGEAAIQIAGGILSAQADQRRQAFDAALQSAVKAANDEAIQPLLERRPFQEEITRALLDPANDFNLQAAAQVFKKRILFRT